MAILQKIMTNCPCYKAGRKITVKGLMLHSVGTPQPSAKVFYNIFGAATYDRASVHAFIDANNGDVWQTLPWDHRAWHCGSGTKGSANNTHIGVEMCESAKIKYTSGTSIVCTDKAGAQADATRAYNAAVELFARLCVKYGLNPLADGVIISHCEGHARGIASNHGDPEHYWRGVGLSYTMNTFRNDVASKMNGGSTPAPATESTNQTTQTTVTAPNGTAVNYQVVINTETLNVRRGPSTKYGIVTTVKKGDVYTIVEEANNGSTKWGKLKSGIGYISLDYTIKKSTSASTAATANTTPAKSTTVGYTVKVTASTLNVRKGPGTLYGIATSIKKNEIYTIVDEKNGWGKLKSEAGWISLAYTKRV